MSFTDSMPLQSLTHWSCLQCNQHLPDLYILPCDHRFCESCLFAWLRTYTIAYQTLAAAFPCTFCWRVVNIPPGGVQIYKRNHQMEQLQLTLQGLQMVEPSSENGGNQQVDQQMDRDNDTMDSGIGVEDSPPNFSIYPPPQHMDAGTFRMSSSQVFDPLNSSQPCCHNNRGNICVAFRKTAGHLL